MYNSDLKYIVLFVLLENKLRHYKLNSYAFINTKKVHKLLYLMNTYFKLFNLTFIKYSVTILSQN